MWTDTYSDPCSGERPQNLSTNLGEGKNLEVIEVEFFTNSMGLGTQNRN
jgi:hypothetical protein